MSNTTKLFINPAGGYILETTQGNFLITDSFVQETDIPTSSLDDAPFDISVQSTIDNAMENTKKALSESFIEGLQLLIQEKIEDLDTNE